MSNNNHSTGVSKFFVGMMLSTALSTGYAFSQNTQPTDLIPAKPKTENVLFRFKKEVISILKSSKDKAEKAFGNKNTGKTQSVNSAETDSVAVDSELQNAINATRLKDRPSKAHLTEGAATDLLNKKTNEIIDRKNAPYSYGDFLERNGGDVKKAAKALVAMTERPAGGTIEQNKKADELYNNVREMYRTVTAEDAAAFVAKTVRPDVKKGAKSGFINSFAKKTGLSRIMADLVILEPLKAEKHLNNMKTRSSINNDTIASLEDIMSYGADYFGPGNVQKAFSLQAQGKGGEPITKHFTSANAFYVNNFKPYDADNKTTVADYTVDDVVKFAAIMYVIDHAGTEQEAKLFKVAKNIVPMTVEEKEEAEKQVVVKEQVKPVENNGSVGEVKFEKGNFYYGYGREMTMANFGDPAGLMPKEYGSGTYALNNTKIGYSHNFSDLKKAFEETGLPPKTQFIAGAEFGLGNINYKEVANPNDPYSQQQGYYNIPAFNKTLPVIGLNASVINGKHKATVSMTNLINLKAGSLDEQALIKKGLSSFYTLAYGYNVKEGVTKNGMQWHFDVGGSYTFSGANKNNINGTDYIAIDKAMQEGKYRIPFASTYTLKAGVGAAIPENVKMFGGTDVKISLTYGGPLAKIGNCKPMTGLQLTISPKSIPFSKKSKRQSALRRAVFDSNVKTALERQSAKAGQTTNFVVTPRR